LNLPENKRTTNLGRTLMMPTRSRTRPPNANSASTAA